MATSSNQQVSARRVEFFLPGAPLPAPRPRFRVIKGKNGGMFVSTYYDKKYSTFLKDAPVEIRKQVTGLGSLMPAPFTTPVVLTVTFHIERPKSTKRTTPRYDIDNYLKSIMDAMTYAGLWLDDDQVGRVIAAKVFGEAGVVGTYVELADASTN